MNPLLATFHDRDWQRARQRRVLGGYVSLGLVKGIPGFLRELGIDPQPLLAEVGLSEKLLEGENNRISLRALGTLLRISADEAGCLILASSSARRSACRILGHSPQHCNPATILARH